MGDCMGAYASIFTRNVVVYIYMNHRYSQQARDDGTCSHHSTAQMFSFEKKCTPGAFAVDRGKRLTSTLSNHDTPTWEDGGIWRNRIVADVVASLLGDNA